MLSKLKYVSSGEGVRGMERKSYLIQLLLICIPPLPGVSCRQTDTLTNSLLTISPATWKWKSNLTWHIIPGVTLKWIDGEDGEEEAFQRHNLNSPQCVFHSGH